jgi:cell division protein DivIC
VSSRRKKKRNAGTVSIGIIVLAFLVIMSVQIVKLKQKVELQEEQIEELNENLAEESERESELLELEESMKDTQFIEDQAKSKLGLVYENEIIFKEKGD